MFRGSTASILLMTLSGLFYMTGITFYLRALQGHEASMVAPFFQCSPLFGYILAYFVLGETLSPRQLLGGALIIVGVLSVSIGAGKMRGRFRWQLAALMLCAGFVLSLSTLDLQGVRHQGRVLVDRVLDVRRRGAVRRGLSLHPPLSPPVHRAVQVERQGAARHQCHATS